jgi:hypothetical protein
MNPETLNTLASQVGQTILYSLIHENTQPEALNEPVKKTIQPQQTVKIPFTL